MKPADQLESIIAAPSSKPEQSKPSQKVLALRRSAKDPGSRSETRLLRMIMGYPQLLSTMAAEPTEDDTKSAIIPCPGLAPLVPADRSDQVYLCFMRYT